MSEGNVRFIVIAFDDEFNAEIARVELKRAASQGLIDLIETAVTVRQKNGKLVLTQDVDLAQERRMQGHWVGIVAASLTGVTPLILAGTAAGALVAKFTDSGIHKGDLKKIGVDLQPGTSALYLLAHQTSQREAILERLRPLGGRVIESDLPSDTVSELDALLREA